MKTMIFALFLVLVSANSGSLETGFVSEKTPEINFECVSPNEIPIDRWIYLANGCTIHVVGNYSLVPFNFRGQITIDNCQGTYNVEDASGPAEASGTVVGGAINNFSISSTNSELNVTLNTDGIREAIKADFEKLL